MTHPTLYRQRIMPEECIRLKDDVVIKCTEDIILTGWSALKPRKDLHHGYSCYFLKEGFKVSKFLRRDNSLLYWYCDIVEYIRKSETNSLISLDLLADVIILPDGSVKVVDLDELAAAFDNGSLTPDLLKKSLYRLNHLLEIIYRGDFPSLQRYIEDTK